MHKLSTLQSYLPIGEKQELDPVLFMNLQDSIRELTLISNVTKEAVIMGDILTYDRGSSSASVTAVGKIQLYHFRIARLEGRKFTGEMSGDEVAVAEVTRDFVDCIKIIIEQRIRNMMESIEFIHYLEEQVMRNPEGKFDLLDWEVNNILHAIDGKQGVTNADKKAILRKVLLSHMDLGQYKRSADVPVQEAGAPRPPQVRPGKASKTFKIKMPATGFSAPVQSPLTSDSTSQTVSVSKDDLEKFLNEDFGIDPKDR